MKEAVQCSLKEAAHYVLKVAVFSMTCSVIFGTLCVWLLDVSLWAYLLFFIGFFCSYVVVDAIELILDKMSLPL
jgi:hypothetical protein